MTVLITALIAAVSSSGICSIALYLIQRHDKKKDNTTKMILGLGHDRIMSLCEKYIEIGAITAEQYEDLNKYLYEPYKALGGNGTAEKLMEHVRKLPIKKEVVA